MIQTEMRKFFYYEEAKKQIFTQLVGKERYQKMLAEVPHREIEDMAVIYRGLISVEGGQIVSFPVTDQIFSFYGISPEQFHEDAVRNTQRMFPAVLQPLMAALESVQRKVCNWDSSMVRFVRIPNIRYSRYFHL